MREEHRETSLEIHAIESLISAIAVSDRDDIGIHTAGLDQSG
jgi:hypothetical protein